MDKSLPTKLYSPNSNKYGPIAESYEELQGLHLLKEFKDQNNLPKASSDSLLRAIFQATEIAIINISILMDRISVERLEHDLRKVIEDFHWIYSLHKLLSKISSLPKSLGFEADFYGSKKRISITKSKAFVKYLETIKCTDEKMLSSIFLPSNFTAREISLTSLENPVIQILQLLRLCNQSAKGWEERLSQVPAPKSMDSNN
ncbi:MAG: hypothetical protein O3A14_19580, partial [Cyanobacteria bacterium]|nr:hypothetical protein [Cyanobacteriota bacterium]